MANLLHVNEDKNKVGEGFSHPVFEIGGRGGEHGVDSVADLAFEVVSVHPEVRFRVSDDWFDGGSPPETLSQFALFVRVQAAAVGRGMNEGCTERSTFVSPVDKGFFRSHTGHALLLVEGFLQCFIVVRVSPEVYGRDNHVAFLRPRKRNLAAKLIFFVSLWLCTQLPGREASKSYLCRLVFELILSRIHGCFPDVLPIFPPVISASNPLQSARRWS